LSTSTPLRPLATISFSKAFNYVPYGLRDLPS